MLVLTSAMRAGPWVVRSLVAAGHRVLSGHPGRGFDGRSRACSSPFRHPSPAREPERFLEWVESTCRREEVAAVVSTDEDVTRLLAARHPTIGGAMIVGPDEVQYARLCQKAELGRTAAVAGIGHPVTVSVGPEGPDAPWPAPPWVVKPRVSGEGTLAGGASPARTPAERDALVRELVAAGLGAIVQEHLSGRQWVVHFVRGRDDFGGVTAWVERRSPRAVGTPSVLRLAPRPEVLAAALRLVEEVDYRGPGNAQFFEREGELVVHDVNLRPPASVGLALRAGFDLPRLGLEAAAERALDLPERLRSPMVYVQTDAEVAALAARLTGRGREPLPSLVRTLLRGAGPHGVLDPGPTDPWWLAAVAGARLRGSPAYRLARRAARRARDRG